MLINAKKLDGYKLRCIDGEIGSAKEFYFDDHHWTVRYLVVNSGNWLTGRKVLISPYALASANTQEQYIPVNLTKKQIEESPSLDSNKPVSKQFEETYYAYYAWPLYWEGPFMWGNYSTIVRDHEKLNKTSNKGKEWDPNLRSTYEVTGYNIQARDGEIGHVSDFIIDEKTWTIRYLVIDTTNWMPGKKILVSPEWITRVSWSESKVFINLSRLAIKESPEYTESTLIDRYYEEKLHHHYNSKGYWMAETDEKNHEEIR